MLLLIFLYLLLTLTVSFLCSILEATLMSTTMSYLTMREEEGSKGASMMRAFKQDTDRPLAAILSLNTIANTVGAAGIGRHTAMLTNSRWIGLAVSLGVTLLILVFAEIIPKTMGTTYWKKMTNFAAYAIQALIYLMYPIVKLIEYITRLFPEPSDAGVSREEVVALASVGEEEGVIEENENRMIRNLMRLDDIPVGDVMTPSVVAAIAPESMTLKDYYDSDEYDHFSRIPVYADSPEYITGYIHRNDALEDLTEDQFQKTLGEIKRSLPMFNEEMTVGEVFDSMLKQKCQIAVVIDEYGSFRGIITLEDVIETIFGFEIIDENDEIADMQQYARERWKQRQRRFTRPLSNRKQETPAAADSLPADDKESAHSLQ